ncbi:MULTISPECIES: ornithine carbamoyltransferase [Aestuariimicrobium]|jgi:ornithine carbamoyltransferase|uniref:ornithine carbamoyltransferase n=1 Tax=Aestuariimicrobium TaxID=396388 RepID=UPI0003B77B2A|nr:MULTISPECIES: ornithine carbamoyltransferase [Aestuariimicrobium]CAI9402644.1 Ornithine carbamoyltransferase [Aestuariimicrobium sp. T2.26MG-19.2B]
MTNLTGRHFLKELDFTPTEWRSLVELSRELKLAKRERREQRRLEGLNFAMIFEKTSTRTRCAFEVAAHDQGAHVTYLDPAGSQIGHKESVADTARVLGRMFDGIEYRGNGQHTVEELARHAGVPVWNGLTDEWHPTQMLADQLTMLEHSDKPLEQISYAYVGDARNNVGNSLLVSGAMMGMDVRMVAPAALQNSSEVIARAQRLAADNGGRVTVTDSVEEGVKGVDFVYTDVWVSMGEPKEKWAERIELLLPYQVNASLMAATGNPSAKFMHCLPAYHDRLTTIGEQIHAQYGLDGVEVSNEVFESEATVAFDQAENRMHTAKAVMVATLT